MAKKRGHMSPKSRFLEAGPKKACVGKKSPRIERELWERKLETDNNNFHRRQKVQPSKLCMEKIPNRADAGERRGQYKGVENIGTVGNVRKKRREKA